MPEPQVTVVSRSRIGTGPGADFSTLISWEAAQDPSPDVVDVAVIDPSDFQMRDEYSEFVRYGELTDGNFYVVNEDGNPLCWRVADKFEVACRTLDALDETPVTGGFLESIKNVAGSDVVISEAIYRDPEYDGKLQLVTPDFSVMNDQLVAYLSENPQAVHELHWRKFEELLSKLFEDMGYQTELGAGRGDEGVDLRLISRADFGDLLCLVQAKKYAEHRRIPLSPVQALYGAVETERANKGVFVSTSEYEPVARRFAKRHSYQIFLAGPDELAEWLKQFRGRNRR